MSSALYPLIGGQNRMPGDTTAGDTIFDSEENQEESKTRGSGSVARYKISPLTLTVFRREVDGNVFHETSLQRTYPKDEEADEFGYTDSLRPRDLRKAGELFRKAANDLQEFELERVE